MDEECYFSCQAKMACLESISQISQSTETHRPISVVEYPQLKWKLVD